MASKQSPKKQTTKKKISKKSKPIAEIAPSNSLLQRFKESRAKKKILNQKQKVANSKKNAANKKSEEIAELKAKQAAIKAKAVEQVESAMTKQNKRRSHPLGTLLLVALIAGLSGAAVWQYRDTEINKKDDEISTLIQTTQSFEQAQTAIEAEKKAEDAKFNELKTSKFSVRVPREWAEQNSQAPLEEKIIGDNNVLITVVNSESRNSNVQFIPSVDYLWQISEDNGQVNITEQSLHCDRFDTLNNDLSLQVREHNGFRVYCDESSEKVVIYALSTPEKFGTTFSNTYFVIEINDIQQINLDDIKTYIQSYKAL